MTIIVYHPPPISATHVKSVETSKLTILKFTRAVKAFNLKIMDPENSYINDWIEEDLMPYVVLIDDGRSDKNDCDTGAKFTISHDQIKLDCSDLYPICFRLIQIVLLLSGWKRW